jgi:hypothetical protein
MDGAAERRHTNRMPSFPARGRGPSPIRRPGSLAAMILVGAAALHAQTPHFAHDEQSLRGLAGVSVTVGVDNEQNGEVPEHHGEVPQEAELQTAVELKLRQAGIRVFSLPELLGVTAPVGSLNVIVRIVKSTTVKGAPLGYAYCIRLAVYQAARLISNDVAAAQGPFVVTTWDSSGAIGMIGRENAGKLIRDAVGAQVNQFANAFLDQNPRK